MRLRGVVALAALSPSAPFSTAVTRRATLRVLPRATHALATSSPNAGAIAPQKALAELSFATMHTVASRYTDKIMAQSDRSPRGRGRGHRARIDPPFEVRRGIQIVDVPTRKGSR